MDRSLTAEEVAQALASMPGWVHRDDKLHKEWKLGSFAAAIAFVGRIAEQATELKHHPEIFNLYRTVRVAMNTHDAGNVVTERDLSLARAIDNAAGPS